MGSDFYKDDEVEQALKNPVIIHYLDAWTGRPWDKPNANPFTPLYNKYKAICFPNASFEGVQRNPLRKLVKNTVVWLYAHLPVSAAGEMLYGITSVWNIWEQIKLKI